MRTITISMFLVLISIATISAQIPNASFETWSNGAPDGWLTNNIAVQSLITVSQSSDAESGSSAAKISVASFAGFAFGPLLWSGTLGKQGFAVSQRYSSLNGFYKFSPTQTDVFSVIVAMLKDTAVIGAGAIDISTVASAYTQFNVNIAYASVNVPDTCVIYFAIANSDSSQPPHIGSYALIDNLSLSTATSVKGTKVPYRFNLSQNYPNPFNPTTIINYSVPQTNFVTIKVYDVLGKEVAVLVNGERQPGNYSVELSAAEKRLASGVYLYRMTAGNYVSTKKFILLK